MKVTVEIPDEDAHIVGEFMSTERIMKDVEFSTFVQVFVSNFIAYLKNIALASKAGVELSADEVQRAQKESIVNALQVTKKIADIRKARSE